jgi:hypothetical protein
VVERMLHGEIVQMKRERLIRITRCHVVESLMSQYCGWQSGAGVVRYKKFREPYTVEPSACRHANKTGTDRSMMDCTWEVSRCSLILAPPTWEALP